MPRLEIVGLVIALAAAGASARTSLAAEVATGDPGRNLYERHCIACHGPQGRGGGYGFFPSSVSDLTLPATQQKSDAELRDALRLGRPHPAMGSWKSVLSDREIDQVLAYVRTFKP